MTPLRACDVCHKRKIQCLAPDDGTPCDWCRHQNLACTYSRRKQANSKKSDAQSDHHKQLLGRIKQLEKALQVQQGLSGDFLDRNRNPPAPLITKQDASDRPPFSFPMGIVHGIASTPQVEESADNVCCEHIAFETNSLVQNWSDRGIQFLFEEAQKWIASMSNQGYTAINSHLFPSNINRLPATLDALRIYSMPRELQELPQDNFTWKTFSIFSSQSHNIFPIFDEVLLDNTIKIAYGCEDALASHECLAARACIWAGFAILTYLDASTEISAIFDSQTCAAKAECLLELTCGTANLDILQTMLLVHKYRTVTGQYDRARLLHSAACRTVCELGGHSYQPLSKTNALEQQSRHVRRLFWLCYISDKDTALLFGLPPVLANDYCDITEPDRYLNQEAFLHANSETTDLSGISMDKLISFLPGDPYLGLLKERVYRLLYSPPALQIINHELFARIRELDSELERWRLSVAPELRPRLSHLQSCCLSMSNRRFWSCLRATQLQLEYHYLLTIIHTTVRRFCATQDDTAGLPNDLHSVMHSSIDLPLEASRSTLHILSEPIVTLKRRTFWHTTFYPLIAALSFFVNILLHPADDQVDGDIRSLELALSVVENMTLARPDANIKHIEQTRDFIAELLRLSKGTILKATNNK